MPEKVILRHPTHADVGAMSELWDEAFGAGDPYCPAFFETVFRGENSFIMTDEEGLCGMLHTVKKTLLKQDARYLYAVATAERVRGRGVFTALHTALLREAREELFFLIPEGEGLVSFYERFGYRTCGFAPVWQDTPGEEITAQQAYELYRSASHALPLVLSRDEFFITAMGKRFYRAGEHFVISDGKRYTSFFAQDTRETTPTAMVRARGSETPEFFALPFFLN